MKYDNIVAVFDGGWTENYPNDIFGREDFPKTNLLTMGDVISWEVSTKDYRKTRRLDGQNYGWVWGADLIIPFTRDTFAWATDNEVGVKKRIADFKRHVADKAWGQFEVNENDSLFDEFDDNRITAWVRKSHIWVDSYSSAHNLRDALLEVLAEFGQGMARGVSLTKVIPSDTRIVREWYSGEWKANLRKAKIGLHCEWVAL